MIFSLRDFLYCPSGAGFLDIKLLFANSGWCFLKILILGRLYGPYRPYLSGGATRDVTLDRLLLVLFSPFLCWRLVCPWILGPWRTGNKISVSSIRQPTQESNPFYGWLFLLLNCCRWLALLFLVSRLPGCCVTIRNIKAFMTGRFWFFINGHFNTCLLSPFHWAQRP